MSCLVSPETVITGHVIGAEEALHISLLNEVAPSGQALPRAQELVAVAVTPGIA